MEDDNVYGSRYRYSPDRPWAASQRACASNNSPPSCSQVDDGLRITWGPSVNSILGNYSYEPPLASFAGGPDKAQSILAKVKRTSTNAGLASPTRPGTASTSTSVLAAVNNLASDNSNGSSIASTSNLPTTSSRFSKRRRRLQSSTSASALTFDSPLGLAGSSETSREGRSLSVDDTSSDMSDMLGELARRLEENRKATLAEREKSSSVTNTTSSHLPIVPSASSTCVDKEKSQTDSTDLYRKNGRSREKVALSPVCSTVVEESMSQGMASMILVTSSVSPKAAPRPVLGAKDINSSTPTNMPSGSDKPKSSVLVTSSLTNTATKVEVVVPRRPLVRATSSLLQPPSNSSGRAPLQKSLSAGNLPAPMPSQPENVSHHAPVKTVSQSRSSQLPTVSTTKLPFADEEDTFWDDNDQSLELAMSQMEIPEPPSSQQPQQQQQQQQPQGAKVASKTDLGLPMPPCRETLAVPPCMAVDDQMTASWDGFKSRDKRNREKTSDSSTSTTGKLSSKPLIAAQASSMKQNNANDKQKTTVVSESAKSASNLIKPTPALNRPTSLLQPGTKPAPQVQAPVPAQNVALEMPASSARKLGLNKSEDRIFRKFKPPTIMNAAAAKAEQEKKAAATEKAARRAGQPLAAEDAWMEDMDWSVDLEESF